MKVYRLSNGVLSRFEDYLINNNFYIWKEYISDADAPGGKILIDCRIISLKDTPLPDFISPYAVKTNENPLDFVK